MPKEQIEMKLGPEEKRILKNLTRTLDKLACSMQLYMPQKPKNDTIRLTEPANLEEGENPYATETGETLVFTQVAGVPLSDLLDGRMSPEEEYREV